jgi:hypothetical protein
MRHRVPRSTKMLPMSSYGRSLQGSEIVSQKDRVGRNCLLWKVREQRGWSEKDFLVKMRRNVTMQLHEKQHRITLGGKRGGQYQGRTKTQKKILARYQIFIIADWLFGPCSRGGSNRKPPPTGGQTNYNNNNNNPRYINLLEKHRRSICQSFLGSDFFVSTENLPIHGWTFAH